MVSKHFLAAQFSHKQQWFSSLPKGLTGPGITELDELGHKHNLKSPAHPTRETF